MADSQAGVVLIVVGVVCLIAGGLLWFVLWPLCGLGFILLLIGIILVAATPSTPTYYAPYPYPYAAPGPAPAPAAGPACPTCGSPLTWIAQYGRWYCYRCQQYR